MRLATIHFTGPRMSLWAMSPVDLDQPFEDLLLKMERSIMSNGNIGSKEWNFAFDLETLKGTIYVPPGRQIGTIEARLINTEEG